VVHFCQAKVDQGKVSPTFSSPVLLLCYYGKVLDFMTKNTRFTKKHEA